MAQRKKEKPFIASILLEPRLNKNDSMVTGLSYGHIGSPRFTCSAGSMEKKEGRNGTRTKLPSLFHNGNCLHSSRVYLDDHSLYNKCCTISYWITTPFTRNNISFNWLG